MTPLIKNLDKFTYINRLYKFRPIIFEDIEDIRNWRNDQITSLRQKKHITRSDQIHYWNNFIFPSLSDEMPDQLLFSLEDCKLNKLIAYGGLVHINWKNKYAESSFLTDTIYNENSKEYEIIFNNYLKFLISTSRSLKLSCIYSETYSFRAKHIKILEHFGYEQYGYLKNLSCSKNSSILHQYLLN
jgi:hypothetical protein